MNQNNTIRIGMIGCGAIAEIYHLPALMAHPQCAAGIALAEPNGERRDELKTKFKAAFGTDNYEDLLDHVDGVIIATPPKSHYPIARFFLDNGKHVLCEKPLTESSDEAAELVRLAEENGVALAVNQTRRFFPTYQKITQLIQEGVLGSLQEIKYCDGIEFDWPAASQHHFLPSSKGAWSDTGVHLLDTICYWLGGKPTLVSSENDAMGGPEAIATVRLQHDDCQAEIKASRLGKLDNGFVIRGTKGSISAGAEDFSKLTIEFADGSKKTIKCGSPKLQYTDFATPMVANFVDVIAGKAKPAVSGNDVLPTIEILEEAYKEAKPYAMPWNTPWTAADIRVATPMRVLVTGASGFVGGRLMETSGFSGSSHCVGTLRKWNRAARPARMAADLLLCDIEDAKNVDQVVSEGDFDAIIHTAYTCNRESIVEGTRNLLSAARKHDVERFIFLSSAEVYGSDVTGNITEESPTPDVDAYGGWKSAAEQVCREFMEQGLKTTIFRPSLIHGPFSGSWSVDVAQRLMSGKWGTFDEHADGNANLVYVDDLIIGIMTALGHDAAINETFNISSGDPPTWNQYFQKMNQALGRPPLPKISQGKSQLRTRVMDRVTGVKDWFMDRYEDRLMEIYMRGGFVGRMMKKLKDEVDATPSGSELTGLYSRRVVYSDAKIRAKIGYQPQFELDCALQATVAWLKLHDHANDKAKVDLSQLTSAVMLRGGSEVSTR